MLGPMFEGGGWFAPHSLRRRLGAILLGLALVVTGGPALAQDGEEEDDCPLLFPDFSSCDREVRPRGSVMPMSAPYIFEDPYIQTGLNFVGIWHEFTEESIFQGGQLGVLAPAGAPGHHRPHRVHRDQGRTLVLGREHEARARSGERSG